MGVRLLTKYCIKNSIPGTEIRVKIGLLEASQFGQAVDLPTFLRDSLQECARVPFTHAAGDSHQKRH